MTLKPRVESYKSLCALNTAGTAVWERLWFWALPPTEVRPLVTPSVAGKIVQLGVGHCRMGQAMVMGTAAPREVVEIQMLRALAVMIQGCLHGHDCCQVLAVMAQGCLQDLLHVGQCRPQRCGPLVTP